MPELPEVETVKNLSIPLWVNQTIHHVEVFLPRLVINLPSFLEESKGKTCTNIERRGKYLIFHFSSNYVLLVHLRMEGKFILLEPNENKTKHTHILFVFENGRRIAYDDSRTFGMLKWMKEEELHDEKMLKKLGPEPFDLDTPTLFSSFQNRKDTIKEALLSQEVIAGIGNIYADEILFASKISPFSITKHIPYEKVDELLKHTKQILKYAIELGGSTIRSFHPSKDIDGLFQIRLQVYDQEDKPCPICHRPLKKVFLSQRGTTYCRFCQKNYHSNYVIGIVGKIASGKSTVLSMLKKDFLVVSADELTRKFYEDKKHLDLLEKRFPKAFDNHQFSRVKMREIITQNPSKKKELEHMIHPYVESEMRKIIHKNKGILFLEIPLLFEAKMEDLCDVIIGITASRETQIRHLKKRKEKSVETALALNESSTFESHLGDLDYIIENNGTLPDLKKKLKEILSIIKSQAHSI